MDKMEDRSRKTNIDPLWCQSRAYSKMHIYGDENNDHRKNTLMHFLYKKVSDINTLPTLTFFHSSTHSVEFKNVSFKKF